MQRMGIVLGLNLIVALGVLRCEGATVFGTVTRVIDGDTIAAMTPYGQKDYVTVRLAGIDAPEKDQPYGKESTDYLSSLVLNRSVRVEFSKSDFFGRVIGTVFLSARDSTALRQINRILLSQGYAWHYSKYLKSEALSEIEKDARYHQRGLWRGAMPVPPWEHRAVQRKERRHQK